MTVDRTALEIVCDTAEEWAGEYGFGNPARATEVLDAVKEVRLTFNTPTKVDQYAAERKAFRSKDWS